jgi:hypothetical protein
MKSAPQPSLPLNPRLPGASVFLRAPSAVSSGSSLKPQVSSFQSLAASFVALCALQKSQLLCNQANPASFCKAPGAGVPPAHPRRALLPPSYASRGTSIPCGLSRLRILPVTTGVCTPNLPNRHSSLATCPVPPLLSQPPFARFPRPAYTSKARRKTPCSDCKHFAPKCVRPCASLCRWFSPRSAG